MIDIIKSETRHFTDMGWLKTYWLFSFSTYYDPANLSHGSLRVFNDDIVEAGTGFDPHPHEEMEIISIVLEGEMVHKDTMGNETCIRKNDVQRMTAGTGLYHSEKNKSKASVHFCQIWIKPDKPGLAPSYDQKAFDPRIWKNRLTLLASDRPEDSPAPPEDLSDALSGKSAVSLNTEASLFRAALDPGKTIRFTTEKEKKAFIYVLDGSVKINHKTLDKNDQARIAEEDRLSITGIDEADFILIDLPGSSKMNKINY